MVEGDGKTMSTFAIMECVISNEPSKSARSVWFPQCRLAGLPDADDEGDIGRLTGEEKSPGWYGGRAVWAWPR